MIPKPGSRAANRLVIRFVTARLKAATQRLRNRIRRIGASKIARSKMTAVMIGMFNYLPNQLQFFVRQQLGGRQFRRVRAYTAAADNRPPDCFAGASTIKARPIMTRAAT